MPGTHQQPATTTMNSCVIEKVDVGTFHLTFFFSPMADLFCSGDGRKKNFCCNRKELDGDPCGSEGNWRKTKKGDVTWKFEEEIFYVIFLISEVTSTRGTQHAHSGTTADVGMRARLKIHMNFLNGFSLVRSLFRQGYLSSPSGTFDEKEANVEWKKDVIKRLSDKIFTSMTLPTRWTTTRMEGERVASQYQQQPFWTTMDRAGKSLPSKFWL